MTSAAGRPQAPAISVTTTSDTAFAVKIPQAPAITAATAPTVFISLRFGEAMLEARALQTDLHARGISAFLCDIPEGQDLAGAVITALTYCKLAVILGTKTYGKKTHSGFSTFEELRYIFEENKPFFLVKMCNDFEEHETRFRLTSSISYFSWQPATDAERGRLPPGLLDRVIRRLEDVTQGRSGYVAPPLAITDMQAANPMAQGSSTAAHSTRADHELGQWLQSLQLSEFEPILRKLGAIDAHDVRDGFAEGEITKEVLEAEGLKALKIIRLRRMASKVSDGCPEELAMFSRLSWVFPSRIDPFDPFSSV